MTKKTKLICFVSLVVLAVVAYLAVIYFKPLPTSIEYPEPSRVAAEDLPLQSTEMLLELVLYHPLRMVNFGAADSALPMNTRFQMSFGSFAEYEEFILRDDCASAVLERYLHTDVLQNTEKNSELSGEIPNNVKYPCALEIIEMMVRQPEISDKLTLTEKIRLAGAQRLRRKEYALYADTYRFIPYPQIWS